jgi:antitoxin component YwqK of YwqJK toxin-antitoxin module
MEADFMERRELFRNSILMLLMTTLFACENAQRQTYKAYVESSVAKTSGGITSVNGQAFSGILFSLYENNDTAFVHEYKNGREHGDWKEFYPGYLVKETRQFNNGKKTGQYIAYWPNGSKQLNYFFVNDEYQGTCREWMDDGTLIKEMNYNNGHEEGPQKAWYGNGKVRSNYTIVNGRRFGLLGTKNCRNVSDSIFNSR